MHKDNEKSETTGKLDVLATNRSTLFVVVAVLVIISTIGIVFLITIDSNEGIQMDVTSIEPGETRDGVYKVNTPEHTTQGIQDYENLLEDETIEEIQRLEYMTELGYTYSLIGEYDKAEEYADSAIIIAREIGNEEYIGEILTLKQIIASGRNAREIYGAD